MHMTVNWWSKVSQCNMALMCLKEKFLSLSWVRWGCPLIYQNGNLQVCRFVPHTWILCGRGLHGIRSIHSDRREKNEQSHVSKHNVALMCLSPSFAYHYWLEVVVLQSIITATCWFVWLFPTHWAFYLPLSYRSTSILEMYTQIHHLLITMWWVS